MTIALFDPSIASENLGDQIICQSVMRELTGMMPTQQIIHLPTQEIIGRRSIRISRQADWRIVGGTNLLTSHMLKYRQWQIGLLDASRMGKVILCGVGWWQYQDAPDAYTRSILRRLLSREGLHSVRDEYTKDKLSEIGITNVVNTGCPTMWGADFGKVGTPARKMDDVVFTITDYHRKPDRDRLLLETLRSLYRRIFFWPQGSGDLAYLSSIDDLSDIMVQEPSVNAFDDVLGSGVDFVGTRLHAGIRAIQKGARAIFIETDNRAKEIARKTGLTVVRLDNSQALENAVKRPLQQVTVDRESIALWRSQFL